MWRFWQLEEGVLEIPPETLVTNDGDIPPVLHVDTDAPLYSTVDGSLITDQMWGIYYKPDWGFGGIQGGASPYTVDTPVNEVAIDPYGPESKEFTASKDFPEMWVSALAHCHKRFEGMMPHYHKEPSGGIGCFTPDSFPVIDTFNNNVTIIADSNHGYKMLGVGCLVAEELLGEKQELLEPFRFSRFKEVKLHPVSNSPYPWSYIVSKARYSAFRVLKEALIGHKGWEPTWRDAEPKADGYDIIIVGGGGHGLATVSYTHLTLPTKA